MKVYINTDIEGVAGWVFYASWSSSQWNLRHLERMNRLMTNEVNAAVRACRKMGAGDLFTAAPETDSNHLNAESYALRGKNN